MASWISWHWGCHLRRTSCSSFFWRLPESEVQTGGHMWQLKNENNEGPWGKLNIHQSCISGTNDWRVFVNWIFHFLTKISAIFFLLVLLEDLLVPELEGGGHPVDGGWPLPGLPAVPGLLLAGAGDGHVGHGAAVPAAAVPAAAAVKRERAETINSEPLSSQQTGVS